MNYLSDSAPAEVVIEAHNFDLDHICTPINIENYHKLLVQSNYDEKLTAELIHGFTNGFDLGYRGPQNRADFSNNLKLRVGSHLELWNKINKEVQAGRVCGPFIKPPYDNFVQSPLGKTGCQIEFCELLSLQTKGLLFQNNVC